MHTSVGVSRTARRRCDSSIGGPSNPQGANVEVKVIDPSANPYFATAAMLGLALDGIERKLTLPPEVTVDPASLTDAQRDDAGIALLAPDQADALDALDRSSLLRAILGDEAVDAVVAVRRYEQQNFGDLNPRRDRREVSPGLERMTLSALG